MSMKPIQSSLMQKLIDLKMAQIKKWFTTAEAAAYLGRSEGAVRNLVYRGKLITRKFGGRIYYSRDELDRAIERSVMEA
jgi:excisionase family DNA binding protein